MPAQNKDAQKSLAQEPVVPTSQPLEPEKELYSWKAPARPFKRRSREFWLRVIVSASVLGLIIFLAEGVMPVILLISVIFLFYVMSNVEPEEVTYKITNRGIKIADKTTDLGSLTRFWFTNRLGNDLLVFETIFLPNRMELTINKIDKEKIKKALSLYLTEEEVPPARIDKVTSWFSDKLSERQK